MPGPIPRRETQQKERKQNLVTTSTLRTGGTRFRFEILQPGQLTAGPDIVEFPAFISTFNDTFSPQWGEYNDMGRADPKVMYEQFSRQINFNFKVVALKTGEARENYLKFNTLAKAAYPHYVPGKGFVGRFVRFTFAKLWENEYVRVSSLDFSPADDTPWDVDDEGKGEWPVVVDVTMTLDWVGDMRPDAGRSKAYAELKDIIPPKRPADLIRKRQEAVQNSPQYSEDGNTGGFGSGVA